MDIKGELIEAKIEVRETTSEILLTPQSASRIMYSLEDLHTWISNGSVWKKQSQKEDQFLDFPLAHISSSMLSEALFQEEMARLRGVINPLLNLDTSWVLADGRNVAGSDYNTYTGNLTVPDMRGTVPRMKDNAKGLNPDGDLALGSYQPDNYANHGHNIPTGAMLTIGATNGGNGFASNTQPTGRTIVNQSPVNSGGNETRAKSTTVNFFIKINRTVL